MEVLERITTSQKVIEALKTQGRSKKWLCEQLEITYATLGVRLKSNGWRIGEILHLQALLGID